MKPFRIQKIFIQLHPKTFQKFIKNLMSLKTTRSKTPISLTLTLSTVRMAKINSYYKCFDKGHKINVTPLTEEKLFLKDLIPFQRKN